MLIEPKSATTTNNDSNNVVVSGQTETPEVTEKKKRGRKPTTNNYFAEREERAVRLFLTASTFTEKNEIYDEYAGEARDPLGRRRLFVQNFAAQHIRRRNS